MYIKQNLIYTKFWLIHHRSVKLLVNLLVKENNELIEIGNHGCGFANYQGWVQAFAWNFVIIICKHWHKNQS